MSSLLARLKAGTKNMKVINFPGTETSVALRVLTSGEIQEAEFATERLFNREGIKVSESTVEAYEKEKTLQMLHCALRDPEDPKLHFAASADELRGLITQPEKDALVGAYLEHQAECSPALETVTEAEFQDLLSQLKKSPGAASSISSISLLQRLVISLASQPATSQTANGSTS